MSGLHISLLTPKALINTTACILVWLCVQACLHIRGWINLHKPVSVHCTEVYLTCTFLTMFSSINRCVRQILRLNPCYLLKFRPEQADETGREKKKGWVERWEKDGESHLTVVADLLMCKITNEHTCARTHTYETRSHENLRQAERHARDVTINSILPDLLVEVSIQAWWLTFIRVASAFYEALQRASLYGRTHLLRYNVIHKYNHRPAQKRL